MRRLISLILGCCIVATSSLTAFAETASVPVTSDVLDDGEVELESYIEWNTYRSKIDGVDVRVLNEIKSAEEDRGILPEIYPLTDNSFVVKTDLGFYGFQCVDGVYYSKSTLHFGYIKVSESVSSDKTSYVGSGQVLSGESVKVASYAPLSLSCGCKIGSLVDFGYAPNGDFYAITSVSMDDGGNTSHWQARLHGSRTSLGSITTRYVGVRFNNDGTMTSMWHTSGLNGGSGTMSISAQEDGFYCVVNSNSDSYVMDKFEWGKQYSMTEGYEANNGTVSSRLQAIGNTPIEIEPGLKYPYVTATEEYGSSTNKYRDEESQYNLMDSGYRTLKLDAGIVDRYTHGDYTDVVLRGQGPWSSTNGRGMRVYNRGMQSTHISSYQVGKFQSLATQLLNINNVPFIDIYTYYGRDSTMRYQSTKMSSKGSEGKAYTDGDFYLAKKYRPKLGKDGKYLLNTTTQFGVGSGMKNNAMKITFSDISLGSDAKIKIYGVYKSASDSSNVLLDTIDSSKNSAGTYTTGILPYGSVTVVFESGSSTSGRGVGFNISDVQYSTYKGGKIYNKIKSSETETYPVQAPNIGYTGATDAKYPVLNQNTITWSGSVTASALSSGSSTLLKSNVKVGNGPMVITFTATNASYPYVGSKYWYLKFTNKSTGVTYDAGNYSSSSNCPYTGTFTNVPVGTYDVYMYNYKYFSSGTYSVNVSQIERTLNSQVRTQAVNASKLRTVDSVISKYGLKVKDIIIDKDFGTKILSTSTDGGETVTLDIPVKKGYSVIIPYKYVYSTSGNAEKLVMQVSGNVQQTDIGSYRVYTYTSDSDKVQIYYYKGSTTPMTTTIKIPVCKTKDEVYTLTGSEIKTNVLEPTIEYCSVKTTPTNITYNKYNYIYYGGSSSRISNSIDVFNTSNSYKLGLDIGTASAISSNSKIQIKLGRSIVNLVKYMYDTYEVNIDNTVNGKEVVSNNISVAVDRYSSSLSYSEQEKCRRDVYLIKDGNYMGTSYSSTGKSGTATVGSNYGKLSVINCPYANFTVKTRAYSGSIENLTSDLAQTVSIETMYRNSDRSDLSYNFTSDKTFTYYLGSDESLFNKVEVTGASIPDGVEVYIEDTKVNGKTTTKWYAKQYVKVDVKVKGETTYGNLKSSENMDLIQYNLYSKYSRDAQNVLTKTRRTVDSTNNTIVNDTTGNKTYSKTITVGNEQCYVNPYTTLSGTGYQEYTYGLVSYTLNTGIGEYTGNGGSDYQSWSDNYDFPSGSLGWFPCDGTMSYSVIAYYSTGNSKHNDILNGKCMDYYYVVKPGDISKQVVTKNGGSTLISYKNTYNNDQLLRDTFNNLDDNYKYTLEVGGRRTAVWTSRVDGSNSGYQYYGALTGNIEGITLGNGEYFVNASSELKYSGDKSGISTSSSADRYSSNNFTIIKINKYDKDKLDITDKSSFTSCSYIKSAIEKLKTDSELGQQFGDVFKLTDIGGNKTFDDGRKGVAYYGDDYTYGSKTYVRLTSIAVQKKYSNGEVRTLARIPTDMNKYYWTGDSFDGGEDTKPEIRHIGNDLMFISANESKTESPGTYGKSLAWLRTGHWIVNPNEEGITPGGSSPDKALKANDSSDIDTSVKEWKMDAKEWEMDYKIKDGVVSDDKMQGGLALSVDLGRVSIVKDLDMDDTYYTKLINKAGFTGFGASGTSRISITLSGPKTMRAYLVKDDDDVIELRIPRATVNNATPGEYSYTGTQTVNGIADVPINITVNIIEAPKAGSKTSIEFGG